MEGGMGEGGGSSGGIFGGGVGGGGDGIGADGGRAGGVIGGGKLGGGADTIVRIVATDPLIATVTPMPEEESALAKELASTADVMDAAV